MSSAVDFYHELVHAPDDETRARIIARAIERIEAAYPGLSEVATRTDLSETELRLQKEIETLRAETREMEGRLQKEIEALRGETREMEGRLQKEIEALRGETREMEGRLRKEIEQVRGSALRWLAGVIIGQTAVILSAVYAMLELV